MPKNQRYAGTAVTERNSVPIRNELTSQLTRWKGICGNMVLGMAPLESRTLVDSTNASSVAPLCQNLLYHFRRLALAKEYWSRWRPSNSFGKGLQTFLRPDG